MLIIILVIFCQYIHEIKWSTKEERDSVQINSYLFLEKFLKSTQIIYIRLPHIIAIISSFSWNMISLAYLYLDLCLLSLLVCPLWSLHYKQLLNFSNTLALYASIHNIIVHYISHRFNILLYVLIAYIRYIPNFNFFY